MVIQVKLTCLEWQHSWYSDIEMFFITVRLCSGRKEIELLLELCAFHFTGDVS